LIDIIRKLCILFFIFPRNRYQEDDDEESEDEVDEVEKGKSGTRPSKINRFIVFLILILILAFFYIPLNLNISKHRSATVAGWNYNTSRSTRLYVASDQNTTLIFPPTVCDTKLLLLIFVCSSTKNFDSRDAIRTTWKRLNYQPHFDMFHPQSEFGDKYLDPVKSSDSDDYLLMKSSANASRADQKFNVKVLFLLGKPDPAEESLQQRIFNESLQFGDIVQEDFVDSYNNLTLKSIFMLKWVTNNCLDKGRFTSLASVAVLF
jgi:Galactosyltransferase